MVAPGHDNSAGLDTYFSGGRELVDAFVGILWMTARSLSSWANYSRSGRPICVFTRPAISPFGCITMSTVVYYCRLEEVIIACLVWGMIGDQDVLICSSRRQYVVLTLGHCSGADRGCPVQSALRHQSAVGTRRVPFSVESISAMLLDLLHITFVS